MSDSDSRDPAESNTNGVDAETHIQAQPRPPNSQGQSPNPQEPTTPSAPMVNVEEVNRGELVSKARAFLYSPQIQYQDLAAKRRFLEDKGLTGHEIDGLLREQSYAPIIPPRTYPPVQPSNLPTLLIGLARLFSWIGIGSAALIFAYYRFLLPRITQTAEARRSMRSYHMSLMRKLTASLSSMKESQSESLAALPRTDPYSEQPQFAHCRTINGALKVLGEAEPDYSRIPPTTLLRCAILDLARGKSEDEAYPTTEEIFLLLEGKIPWLASAGGYEFKKTIYDTLMASPHFVESATSTEDQGAASLKWKYIQPPVPETAPILKSLSALNSSLPKKKETPTSVFQHTLEALTEFTGYISSQVYVSYRPPPGAMGFAGSYGLSPAEEALKKEIRALKGLVLNRKNFMPSLLGVPSTTQRPTS